MVTGEMSRKQEDVITPGLWSADVSSVHMIPQQHTQISNLSLSKEMRPAKTRAKAGESQSRKMQEFEDRFHHIDGGNDAQYSANSINIPNKRGDVNENPYSMHSTPEDRMNQMFKREIGND